MYRAIPTGNKLLTSKWQEHEKNIHKRKLKEIKSSIDNQGGNGPKHLKLKQKKTQMMEGKK
jgi:hypothetical protein